jgi:hypothetical protein
VAEHVISSSFLQPFQCLILIDIDINAVRVSKVSTHLAGEPSLIPNYGLDDEDEPSPAMSTSTTASPGIQLGLGDEF